MGKNSKKSGVFSSVEIFDALAVYLAFSQQGLTTHTIYMSLRDDGMAMVQADDAALLPCNTTLVPKLEPAAPAAAVLGGDGDGGGGGALVGVAVAWQPGQLEIFNEEMLSRFIAGGRPCG
jgi:hypothetical protein